MVKAWHYIRNKIARIMQPSVPDSFARILYVCFLSKVHAWNKNNIALLGSACDWWDFYGYSRCVKKYIKNYKSYIAEYVEVINIKGWKS